MRLTRYIGALLAVAALAACGTAHADHPAHSTAPVDPTAEVEHYREVRDYTNAVRLNETIAWNGAVWGNALLALERDYVPPPKPKPRPVSGPAVATLPPRPASPRPMSGPAVGGSCGGATNGADRFIGAESGGNPDARNASGAWGCYQIMPRTWASSCSDLGQHGSASTDAQAKCASRLPSSSWAATGG